MNLNWRIYGYNTKLNDFGIVYICHQLSGILVSDKERDVFGDAVEIFRGQQGNSFRDEKYYDFKHRKVNDHDFPPLTNRIVIPHGIYDIVDSFGYLTLGTSLVKILLNFSVII